MPDDQPPRDPVSPTDLEADIRLCLQGTSRTSRDNAAREAFALVAELIVRHFRERGYEVTMPRPAPFGPAPDMSPHRRHR